MFSWNTVVMNVRGSCEHLSAIQAVRRVDQKISYEDNGDNGKDQYGFTLLPSGGRLSTCDASFENISLLLFEIQQILELPETVSPKLMILVILQSRVTVLYACSVCICILDTARS